MDDKLNTGRGTESGRPSQNERGLTREFRLQTNQITTSPGAIVDSSETVWERNNQIGRHSIVGNNCLLIWNFEVGSSNLKSEHRLGLRRFITSFLNDSNWVVIGRASNTGNENENLNLSRLRAQEVARFIATLKIDSEILNRSRLVDPINTYIENHIRIEALGQENPIRPNDSPANMARNRSVQICAPQRAVSSTPCQGSRIRFPPETSQRLQDEIRRRYQLLQVGEIFAQEYPCPELEGTQQAGSLLVWLRRRGSGCESQTMRLKPESEVWWRNFGRILYGRASLHASIAQSFNTSMRLKVLQNQKSLIQAKRECRVTLRRNFRRAFIRAFVGSNEVLD